MNTSTPKFDPKRIVFSFGATSDWHIHDEEGQYNRQKLTMALTQLREKAAEEDPRGLAALVAAGDLTHDGREGEILAMRRTLTDALDLSQTAFVYIVGNHDKHDPDCNLIYDRLFTEEASRAYDACELSPDGVWGGARHITVRGVHFLTLGPDKYYKQQPNTFPEATKRWLDETLRQITAREPHSYVFVITHLLMQDTCYGSTHGFFYASDDLTPILSKYPQVVTLGGHLHHPLNDERAIMQTAFTAMETATLSDMLVDGHGMANVTKNTKTENNTDFAQGLLIQIDADGNLRVTRMDFYHHATIGTPWYLDAPTDDGAHLTRYTAARRAAFDPADMTVGQRISFTQTPAEQGGYAVTVHFDATTYARGYVRSYAVTVTDAATDAVVCTPAYMTDFYRYPDYRTMPRETAFTLPTLAPGTYHVTLTARDCWNNEAAPLRGTVTVG